MQLLADPFRLQRVLTLVQRAQYLQCPHYERIVRVDTAPSIRALVRRHEQQRMHAIVGLDLVTPTAFGSETSQTVRFDLTDFHRSRSPL
jgi:hypothetical protein